MKEISWVSPSRTWSAQNVLHGEQSQPLNKTPNIRSSLIHLLPTRKRLKRVFTRTVRLSFKSFSLKYSTEPVKLKQKLSSWRWLVITTDILQRPLKERSLNKLSVKLSRLTKKPANWLFHPATPSNWDLLSISQFSTTKWWRTTSKHAHLPTKLFNKP